MRASLNLSLLAGLLGLALNSVARADEVQITITGTAACLLASGCGVANPTVPFAISFDVNTAGGNLNPSFAGFCGPCLNTADTSPLSGGAPYSVTNYSAVFGGQNIASTGANSFNLQLTPEGNPTYEFYEWDMGTSGLSLSTGVLPIITQAQYMAFKDPLESLLLEFFPTPAAPATSLAASVGEYGLESAFIQASVVPPTGVPEPAPWALWLAGLIGLGLTQLRRLSQQP